MNVVENYIIYLKNEYIKSNETKYITTDTLLFDSEFIKEIMIKLQNIDYNKYLNTHYFFFIPLSNNDRRLNIKFDERNLPYHINNNSIIKTKIITWEYSRYFFILFNYLLLDLDKNDNILLVSRNYGIFEMMKYYNYNNIDHYHYTKENDEFMNKITNKVKSTYSINDYKFGIKLTKKYKFMIFDIILTRFYNLDNFNNETINNKEQINLPLLQNTYDYIDNLELGGDIIIRLSTCITYETIILLENICNCFNKVNIYEMIYRIDLFPYIYCKKYKGKQPIQSKISSNFYNFIKNTYLQKIKLFDEIINKNNYIKDLLIDRPFSDELKQMETKNLYISNEVAKFIGFETYLFKDNLNIELSKNLTYLFAIDTSLIINIHNREEPDFKIKFNTNILIPQELSIISELYYKTINMIDFRPIHIYDNVKKQVRFYESSLNIEIMKLGIKLNEKKPVSRAWIKMYEILNEINFADINKDKKILKIFHLCEAPGAFIHSTMYYMNKHMPSVKLEWHATSLKEKTGNNIGFGDDYGMIRKYPNNWSYGCDKTGDITKVENIKHYKKMCSDMDWIVGDCGIPWLDGDDTIMLRLYYAQILFILHNLKKGGNCIFKFLLPVKHKILIDMFYLLYTTFENIMLFKPIQNKFSPEFYIICYNYNNTVITDFDILFEPLIVGIINKSIITTEYNDDFKYQFIKGIEMITNSFIETINMQIFYTDFWNELDDDIKYKIKEMIHIKNKEFIKKYLQ